VEAFKEQEQAGYQEILFSYQNELSVDGIACLKMMTITQVSVNGFKRALERK